MRGLREEKGCNDSEHDWQQQFAKSHHGEQSNDNESQAIHGDLYHGPGTKCGALAEDLRRWTHEVAYGDGVGTGSRQPHWRSQSSSSRHGVCRRISKGFGGRGTHVCIDPGNANL